MQNGRKEMRFDGERSGLDGEGGTPEWFKAFEREEVGEAAGIVWRRRERGRTRREVGGDGGRRR